MRPRKLMPLVTVLFGALTLAGCVTTGSQGTDSVVPCASLGPIQWSHEDTKATQRQVVGYNAVGKEACGSQPQWKPHAVPFSWASVPHIGRP